jgi:hypothetical protein
MSASSHREQSLHAAAGFLAMGAWAMFANRAHAWSAMVSAGLVQGALSACITLVMKQIIETLAARLSGWRARVLPVAVCFALSVTLLAVTHTLFGTPELFATMAAPVTVATTYAAIYTQSVVARSETNS